MVSIVFKARSSRGSQLAEFGPALFLLFGFVGLPIFAALFLGTGLAVCYLSTTESVKGAASQPSYKLALQSAKNKALEVTNSGIGKLVHLQNTDADEVKLFREITNSDTGKTTEYGPDEQLPKQVDLDHNFYQVEARTTYKLGPIFAYKATSFEIPLLNKSIELTFRERRAAEYPEALFASNSTSVTQ